MMAANGGKTQTPPFKKEEIEIDSPPMLIQNKLSSNSIAERRAAKFGFNVSNINTSPPLASHCFTISPGISPSALLDSPPPVMLLNAQAQQLSPTTGTFQIHSPTNHEGLNKFKLGVDGDDSFNPPPSMPPYSGWPNDKPFLEEFDYPTGLQDPANNGCSILRGKLVAAAAAVEGDQFMDNAESFLCLQANNPSNQMLTSQINQERSTIQNRDRKGTSYIPKEMARYSEDGFYWRKYGQKHVKGSEYPRSYYKCTNTNCLVKKKVERSQDGQITEIVYKGSHNHPKPQPFKTNKFGETSDVITEDGRSCLKIEGAKDMERTSDSLDSFQGDISHLPSGDTVEATETNQNVDHQNQASPESVSPSPNNGVDDDENGESHSKRRKKESFPNEATVPRSTREPRVMVQIESDIDILDDGYRWRKYGQKVVKGNPNPRSYYKCTTPGCPVRKHVERAANDIKSVITTYEGKHNHQVPSNKSGSIVISEVASLSAGVNNANVSPPSTMVQRLDVLKPGKRIQDMPLYAERRPMFNYSGELMRNNFPGRFAGTELNFGAAGASSVYPLSFPPFHSIPYGSVLMNGGNIDMKAYTPSTNVVYPMVPDYVPGNRVTVNPAGSSSNNFKFNSNPSHSVQFLRQENSRTDMKLKQEQRDFGG